MQNFRHINICILIYLCQYLSCDYVKATRQWTLYFVINGSGYQSFSGSILAIVTLNFCQFLIIVSRINHPAFAQNKIHLLSSGKTNILVEYF